MLTSTDVDGNVLYEGHEPEEFKILFMLYNSFTVNSSYDNPLEKFKEWLLFEKDYLERKAQQDTKGLGCLNSPYSCQIAEYDKWLKKCDQGLSLSELVAEQQKLIDDPNT